MSEKILTGSTNGGLVSVHVKDGKIIRIRPMVFEKGDLKPWTITDDKGRKYSPPEKVTLQSFALTEKKRVYGEDRLKYPLKRVDFDPNGDRHTENRGKSGYERISWDEATSIIAGEIKRTKKTYGPEAFTVIRSCHCNMGLVNYRFGALYRFFNMLGFTQISENPDSWEGWHWGATHTYGFYWRLGVVEPYDMLEEALKYSDLIVYWSSDPDSVQGGYAGQESSIWREWFRQAGKKQIVIDPHYNYTAAHVADKWIAPRPGTDGAMMLAMMYVWLKEGTYDKKYVATHTVGFEEFKKYVLGESDGVPKTPKWAEEKSDVPARTITALAREWASKKVQYYGAGLGAACRAMGGTEFARLSVLLQAMQGLGKPGVSMVSILAGGAPLNTKIWFPGYSDPDGMLAETKAAKKRFHNPVQQRIYRLIFPDAILNPPVHYSGRAGFCVHSLEEQFEEVTYPMPNHSEVHMIYRYGGSFISTMCDTNKWVKMYQSPKIEFVVNQDCWWGNETKFADIILPSCTSFERDDISGWNNAGGYFADSQTSGNYNVVVYQKKCIEPMWESKPDYEIFSLIAEKLGVKEDFTDGGKTADNWIRAIFDLSDLPKYTTFEEFKRKGYFVIPVPDDYKPTPAMRWFYEGRACDTPDPGNKKKNTAKANELGTYSGKIEFVSQSLLTYHPEDEDRPPMPRYYASPEGHESPTAKKYPLQLITPHPRYSFHTHYDKRDSWVDEIPEHRVMKDGYPYMVASVSPSDAATRGIVNGDIIKLYNDRGAVLGVAKVTERVRPGTVHSWSSSGRYDPIEPGKLGSVDRGGCMNLLSTSRLLSPYAPGMTPAQSLIEIEKWEV